MSEAFSQYELDGLFIINVGLLIYEGLADETVRVQRERAEERPVVEVRRQ